MLARPRPRVVVVSTGSELREPGTDLGHDSIYDGNSFLLAAAARRAGALAYRVGIVPDEPRAFLDALHDQLVRADLVVTSGGVSQGDYDVVKEALAPLGTVWFGGVAMQPGKPQGFGHVGEDRTPIFTLPGNPVSSYISFELFVLPAIRKLMGRTPYARPATTARLTRDLRSPDGRRQFARASYSRRDDGPGGDARRRARFPPDRRSGTVRRADRGAGGRRDGARRRAGAGAEARRGVLMAEPARPTSTSPAPPGWSTCPARTSPPAPPTASGRVLVSAEVVALLRGEGVPKGDALAVARIAGIMGAKQTPALIPLCHPLAVSGVTVDLAVADDAVEITATVRTTDRTGVEMEALTAVSVAALTVVDMVKAVDKGAVITDVRVETKTGGKTGDWAR